MQCCAPRYWMQYLCTLGLPLFYIKNILFKCRFWFATGGGASRKYGERDNSASIKPVLVLYSCPPSACPLLPQRVILNIWVRTMHKLPQDNNVVTPLSVWGFSSTAPSPTAKLKHRRPPDRSWEFLFLNWCDCRRREWAQALKLRSYLIRSCGV